MLYEDATCQKDNEAIEELRSTGQGKEVMAKYKVSTRDASEKMNLTHAFYYSTQVVYLHKLYAILLGKHNKEFLMNLLVDELGQDKHRVKSYFLYMYIYNNVVYGYIHIR